MKPKFRHLRSLAIASSALLTISYAQAATFTWDPTNVTGTPPATLDWLTGGSNPLGLWTGSVAPVSASDTEIRFFPNSSTSVLNNGITGNTQTVNLNNGVTAFQLGTLTLNGFGSATNGANLAMTLQGSALNFSGATGTISFTSFKNVALGTDPGIDYNINNNIQLGTASSASALTLTSGSSGNFSTYNIGGIISELQAGGGSILKSGGSTVTINGALSITGGVTVSAGQLNLTNSTNTASSFTVNGGTLNVTSSAISATTITANTGTLILTGNLNPASASMTVNTGGALRIGNGTATQFGTLGVYSGDISTGTGGTLQLWSSSAQELSGIISGSGGINKANGGALTLSNSNTYTGRSSFIPQNTTGFTQNVASFNSVFTNVGLGTVHSASSTLGAPTTVANGTIDVGGNAQASITLNYTGAGETTDRVVAVAWNGNSTQTISTSGGGLLKFTSGFTAAGSGGTGSLVLGGAGNGEVNGITGSVNTTGLSKIGNGTWTISGPSTFSQQTTVTAGILNLTSATALQNSPFNTASTLGTGLIGLRTTTTTLTLGGLTGANALKGRFTTATGGPSNATANGGYAGLTNLTLNTVAGANLSYTGAIVDGATGMSLTKTGAGIQTITAANTYTGTTFVNGGFLQLNGSTLTGGLSVTNAALGSNSSFAGASSVTSGTISPGASFGAIGNLTFTSSLNLNGSTGIFDLSATDATTPDRIAVTGGLAVTGSNTVLLRTPTGGTAAGTYTLMTSSALSGAGSLVLANGSATRGNATISTSGNDVILTVAAGGLAGTTTYTGTSGAFNSERWNTAGNWSGGAVPTGTTNVVIADQTAAFNVPVFNASTPTFTGDLWIGNNVTLQIGSAAGNLFAANNNALGTPGSTIIYMGQNSAINSRNSGFNPTMPQIILLGDASMRFQESTQGAVNPTFGHSISGAFTLTLNSGNGSTHTFNAANSFAGLNFTGTNTLNAAVSGSIGSANLAISGGGTVNLNHATAISDGANAIRINNGILAYGTTPTAALTLGTRPIELNGTGNATINNANTLSSSANTLTLGGGISSTAAGAKTLTLGGANAGNNTISGAIIDGTAGSIALTKADAGKWVLSNNNTYTGATSISAGTLRLAHASAVSATPSITLTAAAATLQVGTDTAFSGPRIVSTAGTIVSDRATAGAGLTHAFSGVSRLGSGNTNITAGSNVTSGTAAIQFASLDNDNGTVAGFGLNPTTADVIVVGGVNMGGGANAGTANFTLTGTSTGNSIGGAIINGARATANVIKSGTGTWTLSGNNSYNGTTGVSAGHLIMSGNNTIGGLITVSGASGATLTLSGDNSGMGGGVTLSTSFPTTAGSSPLLNVNSATALGTGTLNFGGGAASDTVRLDNTNIGGLITVTTNNVFTLNRNFTFIGTQSLDLGNMTTTIGGIGLTGSRSISVTANTLTLGGTIGETGGVLGVTKTGAGTLAFKGTGNYTGPTAVNAGTLSISSTGSTHASSAVTVSNSGSALVVNGTVNGTLNASASTTISGSGTVVGAATVSGNLRPGTSPGELNFSSSLALANSTSTTMEINGTTLGLNYDNIDVGTALTYDGILTLAIGATFGSSAVFDLFEFASQTGNFDSVALTGNYTGTFTNSLGVWSATTNAGNETWSFSQTTGDLTLTVVPEPSTALLAALGALALFRRRR